MLFKDLKKILSSNDGILIILYDRNDCKSYFCGYACISLVPSVADSYEVLGIGKHDREIMTEHGCVGIGIEVVLNRTCQKKENYEWLTKNEISGIYTSKYNDVIKMEYNIKL